MIDFEVLSKHCRQCDRKKRLLGPVSAEYRNGFELHKGLCTQNYDGSSGNMEVVAAERLWNRSEKYGFRYTTVVSDGDSKKFCHLSEIKPYGDKTIDKVECLNHVAKRLGTGLRNIRSMSAGTNEPLGGKKPGSLKASTMDKLTVYYRNAIEKNLGDVKKMKDAIYATLYHCKSTDDNPQHHYCPESEESWCFYNRAVAKREKPESHSNMLKTPIREEVAKKIMPLYNRLASDTLLKICVFGKTQNANEALHGVIWSKCPKTTFASRKKLELCVCEAICQYNTGYNKSVFTFQLASGVSPGSLTSKDAKRFDRKRFRLSKVSKNLKVRRLQEEIKASPA